MLGLSLQAAWLIGLLLISSLGFLAAARWADRLTDGRPIVFFSVGLSVAVVLLALASGILVLRR
jgi:hypothetical protein